MVALKTAEWILAFHRLESSKKVFSPPKFPGSGGIKIRKLSQF